MARETGARIYNGICNTKNRRTSRGRKKKSRRCDRANSADGWECKRAGRLAPQPRTSKEILHDELHDS